MMVNQLNKKILLYLSKAVSEINREDDMAKLDPKEIISSLKEVQSDRIGFRIPKNIKSRFLKKCKEEKVDMSKFLVAFIEKWLESEPSKPSRKKSK